MVMVCYGLPAQSHAVDEVNLWTLRPYAMRIVVVAETRSVASEQITAAIAHHLQDRVAAVVGPLWQLSVVQPMGVDRTLVQRVLATHDIHQLAPTSTSTDEQASPASSDTKSSEQQVELPFEPAIGGGQDKLMLLSVREGPLGFIVEGVEYDLYLRRLGPPLRRELATSQGVLESVFQMACDLFSPVAIFTINRENRDLATLSFRGVELPAPESAPQWFAPGDVFLPMLRRTDRDGVSPVDGVQTAPWTLLQVTDVAKSVTAQVVSHARRPFSARRRGRVEQLAIHLPVTNDSTRLYLHARSDPKRPLVGYHVFARDTADGELVEIGASNEQGVLDIPRTDAMVRTLFVKSGRKLVAKLPMAPGAELQLAAPLVDESKRLEAEAKLSLLREELIDLVARRNILITRAKAALKAGEYEKADGFVTELEGLPGLSIFNQRLTEQEQVSRARDTNVQARIDRLFEDTRAVLGRFLGSREIVELRRKLDATVRAARNL